MCVVSWGSGGSLNVCVTVCLPLAQFLSLSPSVSVTLRPSLLSSAQMDKAIWVLADAFAKDRSAPQVDILWLDRNLITDAGANAHALGIS